MARSKTIYKEKPDIFAKYYHPQSDDFLEYKTTLQIKDSGKQPIIMQLKFDGMEPFSLRYHQRNLQSEQKTLSTSF